MIPKGSSFPPFFTDFREGVRVVIKTEPGPKDNPKLPAPFYCEIIHDKKVYTLSFNLTSYYRISRHQAFGLDTKDWIGGTIQYVGKTKCARGSMAKTWGPVELEIDLDNEHLKEETPDEFKFGKNLEDSDA